MAKTIKIKKTYVRNFILSFLIGFGILYGLEHFGTFSYIDNHKTNNQNGEISFGTYVSAGTGLSAIFYKSFFGNEIRTNGNGFTVGDLIFSDSSFDKYSNKSYYYTQATMKDFKYGIYFSIGLFFISVLLTEVKIKLT